MLNSASSPTTRTPLLRRLGKPFLLVIPAIFIGLLVVSKLSTPRIEGKELRSWAKLANSGDQNAIRVLTARGSNAVPDLIRLLNDKDSRFRQLTWASSQRLPLRIKTTLSKIIGPPDAGLVQAGAVRALRTLGPDSRAAIPSLAERLHDPSHQNRFEAAVALGYIGPEAVPWLCAALESKSQTDRAAIANALAQAGTNSGLAYLSLIKALRNPDAYVRATAASALERIGVPGLNELRDTVMHGDPDARCAAAKELLSLYEAPFLAVRALEDMAHDSSAVARQRAIEVLGRIQPRRRSVLNLWITASEDPVPEVRMTAVQALSDSGSTSDLAVVSLQKRLSDSSPAVRECAANALGKLGLAAKSALPALTGLQEDQDAKVRAAAREAVTKVQASP